MLRVWGCMVQYWPASATTGKIERRARWGVHLGTSFEHHAWTILDHDTSRVVMARDVIFYEDLSIRKFQCDRHADHTRGEHNIVDYERPPHSFATPEDEAEAALADQDHTDPHPGPRPWSDEDDDEDSAPLDSSRESLLSPTPSSGHNSDDDVVEVTSDQRHSPGLSRLHILGLQTAVSWPPKAVEPKTPCQAVTAPYAKEWCATMNAEVAALEAPETWVMADCAILKGRRVLSGKWVFHVKTGADSTIERFKARWVVRGFDQHHGIDFDQTFAPVSHHTSVRILLAIADAKHLLLRQIDVKKAFLYALDDALIFVEQPHTYSDGDDLVCQLKKSLYGIKKAPRLWQQHLHQILLDIGFIQLPHDCQRSTGDPRLILGKSYRLAILGGYGRTDPLLNKPFYPSGLVTGNLTWYQSEGLGFESQCVHFGHPSVGGCQRSTSDPRLILGKGYRHVVLGGCGRTDPLLNKPFYPSGLVVGILTTTPACTAFTTAETISFSRGLNISYDPNAIHLSAAKYAETLSA
ncbi:unnamed protein product, partial [Closterium sp. NIES-54]